MTSTHLRRGLRSALAALLGGCDSVTGARPIDISRGLGIDMKLAWKISHLAEAARPFDSARHLPGMAGMRIFLDAARRREADSGALKQTEDAFESVQKVIAEHCGSRKVFEAMVTEIQKAQDQPPEQADRERLFEGARSVWGLKADLIHRMDILHPCRVEGLLDCVTIRTLAGIRRLRGGVPLVFPRPRVVDDRGMESRSDLREPLDSGVGPNAFPTVGTLCDGPIPTLHGQTRAEGTIFEALPLDGPDPLSFTVVTGEILRAAQPTRVQGDSHGIYQLMRLRVPSPRAIFDVLVHESLVDHDVQPDSYLASELHVSASFIHNVRRVRLPIGVRRREIEANETPDLDCKGGTSTRLEIAMQAADCRREDFRWFRLEVEYPPICSLIAFEFEQPSS
ncbi:MAG: hypothetical protein GY704_17800 [Phycisphaeraceae bacterium]|nr:hypothetical protein [Phycisphaeraceae bacterium]